LADESFLDADGSVTDRCQNRRLAVSSGDESAADADSGWVGLLGCFLSGCIGTTVSIEQTIEARKLATFGWVPAA